MWGGNDPCCRKPMVWPEVMYEAEVALPDGRGRAHPDEVAFDRDLFDTYRSLIAVRKSSPALRRGDYQTLLADDARRLFAFARRAEGDEVLVALNADELMNAVELDAADGPWTDALSGATYQASDGRLSLTIPPLAGAILRRGG